MPLHFNTKPDIVKLDLAYTVIGELTGVSTTDSITSRTLRQSAKPSAHLVFLYCLSKISNLFLTEVLVLCSGISSIHLCALVILKGLGKVNSGK